MGFCCTKNSCSGLFTSVYSANNVNLKSHLGRSFRIPACEDCQHAHFDGKCTNGCDREYRAEYNGSSNADDLAANGTIIITSRRSLTELTTSNKRLIKSEKLNSKSVDSLRFLNRSIRFTSKLDLPYESDPQLSTLPPPLPKRRYGESTINLVQEYRAAELLVPVNTPDLALFCRSNSFDLHPTCIPRPLLLNSNNLICNKDNHYQGQAITYLNNSRQFAQSREMCEIEHTLGSGSPSIPSYQQSGNSTPIQYLRPASYYDCCSIPAPDQVRRGPAMLLCFVHKT
ncbi:unnamed protein product [Protopolystoma xenopodis]|uniref:Uncharacterized protein n=1 Tax=Protopolystoma xenopodis TaxID=117903 RepID=A0A448XAV7_9PLAT|nr:unnamed protein product [Protopolystoma xenopodis]